MKINYFSDLHLEFGSSEAPSNDAELIVAAGDIGLGLMGLEWLQTLNKTVIYVAGNHEFYDHEHGQHVAQLRALAQGSNVHFLENDVLIVDGVRFIGCTLWTNLLLEGDLKANVLGLTLNDFKKIQYQQEVFNQQHFTQLYKDSCQWLEAMVAQPFAGKTVVVTHHAPANWSWNKAPGDLKRMAYCNDLKGLLYENPVDVWFHGHVHGISDYRIADTRVLCNPRGYVGKKLVPAFDLNCVVDI